MIPIILLVTRIHSSKEGIDFVGVVLVAYYQINCHILTVSNDPEGIIIPKLRGISSPFLLFIIRY